jgi:hypothetical protein
MRTLRLFETQHEAHAALARDGLQEDRSKIRWSAMTLIHNDGNSTMYVAHGHLMSLCGLLFDKVELDAETTLTEAEARFLQRLERSTT